MKDGAETWAQPTSFEPSNFKSKAAIKRALAEDPASVSWLEIGTVANGFQDTRRSTEELLAELEGGRYVLIVGPDPYRLRNFFGQVRAKGGKLVVS
jgi:hypothetical protein